MVLLELDLFCTSQYHALPSRVVECDNVPSKSALHKAPCARWFVSIDSVRYSFITTHEMTSMSYFFFLGGGEKDLVFTWHSITTRKMQSVSYSLFIYKRLLVFTWHFSLKLLSALSITDLLLASLPSLYNTWHLPFNAFVHYKTQAWPIF